MDIGTRLSPGVPARIAPARQLHTNVGGNVMGFTMKNETVFVYPAPPWHARIKFDSHSVPAFLEEAVPQSTIGLTVCVIVSFMS
jgi:hypothetical protein